MAFSAAIVPDSGTELELGMYSPSIDPLYYRIITNRRLGLLSAPRY